MKRLLAICTVLFMCVTTSVMGSQAPSKETIETYLDEISYYQMSTVTEPTYSSVGGEWTVFGLARYGTITQDYQNKYVANIKREVEKRKGVLSSRKYTEYARVSIALTAVGENPENVSGYNLLKPFEKFENVISQGVSGAAYALLALDCGNYEIPKTDDGHQTTRDKIVGFLKSRALEGGGWNYAGTAIDVDVTAMAIQALAPYSEDADVKRVIDSGIKALGAVQNTDGSFGNAQGANCESTAQVLTALSVTGTKITDSRFVKNGKTVIDGLMTFYNHDGSFCHTKGAKADAMATDQAMYALAAYYRSINGNNSIFEMKDGIVRREISKEVIRRLSKEETTAKPKEETKASDKTDKKSTNNKEKNTKNSEKNKTAQADKKSGKSNKKSPNYSSKTSEKSSSGKKKISSKTKNGQKELAENESSQKGKSGNEAQIADKNGNSQTAGKNSNSKSEDVNSDLKNTGGNSDSQTLAGENSNLQETEDGKIEQRDSRKAVKGKKSENPSGNYFVVISIIAVLICGGAAGGAVIYKRKKENR